MFAAVIDNIDSYLTLRKIAIWLSKKLPIFWQSNGNFPEGQIRILARAQFLPSNSKYRLTCKPSNPVLYLGPYSEKWRAGDTLSIYWQNTSLPATLFKQKPRNFIDALSHIDQSTVLL